MNAQVKEEWINPPPAAPERTGEISAALAKAQAEMANLALTQRIRIFATGSRVSPRCVTQ